MSSFGFYGTNANPDELLRQRHDDVGMAHAHEEELWERHQEEQLDRQADDERREYESYMNSRYEEAIG